MTKKIAILDYDAGNLLSIKRAIEQFNISVDILAHPDAIHSYDAIVLPGVGAFKEGMQGLKKHNFIDAIKNYVASQKPLLGICLGMQMLFEHSEEFEFTKGLSLIKGSITKLPGMSVKQMPQRVPHVGWSKVQSLSPDFFSDIAEEAEYYFCHSYAANPANTEHITSYYNYGGHNIIASVALGKVYGFQFHPEKSGAVGLKLIENFLRNNHLI